MRVCLRSSHVAYRTMPQKVRTCSHMTCAPSSRFAAVVVMIFEFKPLRRLATSRPAETYADFWRSRSFPETCTGMKTMRTTNMMGKKSWMPNWLTRMNANASMPAVATSSLSGTRRTCVIQPKTASPHVPSGRGRGGGRCVWAQGEGFCEGGGGVRGRRE